MKVIEKYQNSDLNNSDVKWYLFDEHLWITKYKDYSEIEESILKSVGSFNWLYEINDTVLFSKEGRFETAIIGLADGIRVDEFKEYSKLIKTGRKGDLFIADDFGFVIIRHQLKGWFLKKASEHVCVTRECNKEITPHMLARYLNALKLWEKDEDATELKSLLEESKSKKDEFSCALRECIMNLL